MAFTALYKKQMLGSRNTGVMSGTGINQKEIILRTFNVDRSIPNLMSTGPYQI